MSRTHADFAPQFAEDYPAVGRFEPSAPLMAEQVSALGEVVGQKVTELAAKEALDRGDAIYLGKVADMGARSVAYLLDRGAELPPAEGEFGTRVSAVVGNLPGDFDPVRVPALMKGDGGALAYLLNSRATGSVMHAPVGVSGYNRERENVQRVAANIFPVMAGILGHNAAIGRVFPSGYDPYLSGNLNEVVSNHQLLVKPAE